MPEDVKLPENSSLVESDIENLLRATEQLGLKQEASIQDTAELKQQLAELSNNVEEVLVLFKEGKIVINFFAKAGTFAKWLAVTVASIGAMYAATVHFFKS